MLLMMNLYTNTHPPNLDNNAIFGGFNGHKSYKKIQIGRREVKQQ